MSVYITIVLTTIVVNTFGAQQVWVVDKQVVSVIDANGLHGGVHCGNSSSCMLFTGPKKLFDEFATVLAYRASDGKQQWHSDTVAGFGNNVGYADHLSAATSNSLCFSGSTKNNHDDRIDAAITCIDGTTGKTMWRSPLKSETVGGAGIDLTPLPGDDGVLLISDNNADPGMSSETKSPPSELVAWVARISPKTGVAAFNLTFEGDAIKTWVFMLPDKESLFMVVGPHGSNHNNLRRVHDGPAPPDPATTDTGHWAHTVDSPIRNGDSW